MIVGNIVTPNVKGQIVIPHRIRKSLGINTNTPLQVSQIGNAVVLHPIVGVVTKSDDQQSYLEILKKTAGSWAGDDWPKTRARRRKIELKASQRRKRAW